MYIYRLPCPIPVRYSPLTYQTGFQTLKEHTDIRADYFADIPLYQPPAHTSTYPTTLSHTLSLFFYRPT
jgi:hypothetical protein